MFKIERPPEPPMLQSKGYGDDQVVWTLWKMCHEKCYLCETKDLQSPQVEHKKPKTKNPELEKDWNNLFYACSRCNTIKRDKDESLLDVAQVDPITKIIWNLPPAPDSDITFETVDPNSNDETVENTINLLKDCFNKKQTGIRGITREALIEKIDHDFEYFLKQSHIISNPRSIKEEIHTARERLKVMLQVEYQYSAFWRWRFLRDPKLMKEHSDLLPEYRKLSRCYKAIKQLETA